MEVPVKQSCSWTLKAVLNCRDIIQNSPVWDNMLRDTKYKSRAMYEDLKDSSQQDVAWRKMLFHNLARPRAVHILWRACHNSLATKERLCRFGMLANMDCCFCGAVESLQHLLFECNATKVIWHAVLKWLQFHHSPLGWKEELVWMLEQSNRKGWRYTMLKCAFTEAVYEIWCHRNRVCLENEDRHNSDSIVFKIIDNVIYRCWSKVQLRQHIGKLMLP
ncbi:uncharacterized protein LOC131646416 [Vicia villosa]|uniref:uncharacterized protein LOC131646416 n=1 Tax=Vicia villosa TaxID=3911 RepID=UPI00273B20EF|nr:uncharacterized protein LOC131646416 [Vicia villosa]